MKSPRMLVVGSFVMDLTVTAERFVSAGESMVGTGFSTACGGKGANQAAQAARLGARVTTVGKVGDDEFGRALIASAKKDDVDVRHVGVSAKSPTGCANIQIAAAPRKTENRIVLIPGANMDITPEDVAFLEEDIKNYDIVLLQLEIPMEINCLTAGYAFAAGVPVMLNSAPYAPVPSRLLSRLSFISPNEHEARAMTGIEITDEKSAAAAAGKILETGPESVIITLGSRGAVYSDGKRFIISPAMGGVNAVDPTAAGDSFVGSFCFALSSGLTADKALEFANCAASVTVSRMGAQPSLPTLEQVRAAAVRHGIKI